MYIQSALQEKFSLDFMGGHFPSPNNVDLHFRSVSVNSAPKQLWTSAIYPLGKRGDFLIALIASLRAKFKSKLKIR